MKPILLFLALALFLGAQTPASWAQQGTFRERLRKRLSHTRLDSGQKLTISGLNVAIWEPAGFSAPNGAPAPLVIFSHGFHGVNTQSIFLMKALAQAGYLVIAPNHKDAITNGMGKSEERFGKVANWTDNTYKDREKDIQNLIDALHRDTYWNTRINWSKLALAGHSLGGYTVLGLAGAWPSWKLPGVKAVVALSPYSNPFLKNGTLGNIDVPVMYQSGTRDTWINLFVKAKDGAFTHTHSPALYVELDNANHFAWTNLEPSAQRKDLVCHYCIEFLNKYVLANAAANPEQQLPGITTLRAK